MSEEQVNEEVEQTEEAGEEKELSYEEKLEELTGKFTEEKEEVQEEPQEEEQSASERLVMLKQLDRENRLLKQEMQELEALKSLPELLQNDPLGTLQELGLSVDEILDHLSNYYGEEGEEEEDTQYINKINELEQRLNERELQEQSYAAQQQEQQAIDYVSSIVESNSDRWSFVSHTPEIINDVLVAAEQDAQAGVDIDDKWVETVLDKAEAILSERYGPVVGQTAKVTKPRVTIGSHAKSDTPSGFAGLSYEETLKRLTERLG